MNRGSIAVDIQGSIPKATQIGSDDSHKHPNFSTLQRRHTHTHTHVGGTWKDKLKNGHGKPREDDVSAASQSRRQPCATSSSPACNRCTMVLLADFTTFLPRRAPDKHSRNPKNAADTTAMTTTNTAPLSPHKTTQETAGLDPVQTKLATVNQMLNTFNRLPGLLFAIPSDLLADQLALILVVVGALLQEVVAKSILWRPVSSGCPPSLLFFSWSSPTSRRPTVTSAQNLFSPSPPLPARRRVSGVGENGGHAAEPPYSWSNLYPRGYRSSCIRR